MYWLVTTGNIPSFLAVGVSGCLLYIVKRDSLIVAGVLLYLVKEYREGSLIAPGGGIRRLLFLRVYLVKARCSRQDSLFPGCRSSWISSLFSKEFSLADTGRVPS